MTPVDETALRAFERERWARQAEFAEAWIEELSDVPAVGDALRRLLRGEPVRDGVRAQIRFDVERDLARLRNAIAGKTPSAVRAETPHPTTQHFARAEADHTAENALVFLRKAATELGAVERAQRWIQRLRWEFIATDVDAAVPVDFSARIVAAPHERDHLIANTARELAQLRARLGAMP